MLIGQKIKQRRNELGLTQLELAAQVNKSAQVVSNWERGYTPTINYDDVTKLAEALNVEPNWLLGINQVELADHSLVLNLDLSNISTEEAEAFALIRKAMSGLSPAQRKKSMLFLKHSIKTAREMVEEMPED